MAYEHLGVKRCWWSRPESESPESRLPEQAVAIAVPSVTAAAFSALGIVRAPRSALDLRVARRGEEVEGQQQASQGDSENERVHGNSSGEDRADGLARQSLVAGPVGSVTRFPPPGAISPAYP